MSYRDQPPHKEGEPVLRRRPRITQVVKRQKLMAPLKKRLARIASISR